MSSHSIQICLALPCTAPVVPMFLFHWPFLDPSTISSSWPLNKFIQHPNCEPKPCTVKSNLKPHGNSSLENGPIDLFGASRKELSRTASTCVFVITHPIDRSLRRNACGNLEFYVLTRLDNKEELFNTLKHKKMIVCSCLERIKNVKWSNKLRQLWRKHCWVDWLPESYFPSFPSFPSFKNKPMLSGQSG